MTQLPALILGLGLSALAVNAQASGFIIGGGGLAHDCYLAAKAGLATPNEISLCTTALKQEQMEPRDRAGTYINRGTLLLLTRDYAAALADFDKATQLGPELGEAWVNRAAALIGLQRFSEAVSNSDRGIALNPKEPEKAYFNRATARELLGDLEGAYHDYARASELAPDWADPKIELVRFKVEKK